MVRQALYHRFFFGGVVFSPVAVCRNDDIDRHSLVEPCPSPASFPVQTQTPIGPGSRDKGVARTNNLSLVVKASHSSNAEVILCFFVSTSRFATDSLAVDDRVAETKGDVARVCLAERANELREVGSEKSPQRPDKSAKSLETLAVVAIPDWRPGFTALLAIPGTLFCWAWALFARFAASLTPSRPAHR